MNNTPKCDVAHRCGGCQQLHLPYEDQLAKKQSMVSRLLGKFCKPAPILGMKHPYHYRNKTQMAFVLTKARRITSGVYQSGSHTVVSTDSCLLTDKASDRIIATIRRLMPSFKLLPYQPYTGRGFLRHVLVRRGFRSGEIMVVLVSATPVFPGKNNFVRALLEQHPEITTIVHNVNRDFEGLMLGPNEKVLYGPGYIEDTLCGCIFRISSRSFYQVNPTQTERLYKTALDFAALTGDEVVLDAYCGIGTIGLCAAKKAKLVIGVESNRDAVRDAISNCKRNQIKNARFVCADAGAFMQEFCDPIDVAFVDPPRAGCSKEFLESLLTLAPKKIVYVSCNPETLARDLRTLTQAYSAEALQPVDMFPHTNHCECVVKLLRK